MRKLEAVFVFLFGAGVGAGLTYYSMNKVEYESIVDNYDEEEPEYDYEKRAAILDAKNEGAYLEEMENMSAQEVVDRLNRIIEEDEPDREAVKKMRDGVVVNMLSKDYRTKSGDKKPKNYSATSGETNDLRKSDNPYIIGKGDFEDESAQNYEKRTLFFYPEDAVMVDDEDHLFEQQDRVIDSRGYLQVDDFHEPDEKIPSVFYIRNDFIETDFEVFWLHNESFEDTMTHTPRG